MLQSYSLSGSRSRLSRDHWDNATKDINEIIILCASTVWNERKAGLIGLYNHFSDGKVLDSAQLKKVTEIFPKMFMDQNTKVVSLFLDTLNELLIAHNQDLHDWLYQLLQRIFNKLGSGELLGSIYKKIEKTLDVIRTYFPIDLQYNGIFRYLTDHTQRPNSKVKITILVYLIHLSEQSQSILYDSNSRQLCINGLDKIVAMTEDKKSTEVQNVAKNCIITLLNCNTSHFMLLLSQLPRDKQDIVSNIIDNLNVRKSSVSSHHIEATNGVDTSSSSTTPVLLDSPTSRLNQGFNEYSEDIQRSLRNTTAEIQNYTYEGSNGKNGHNIPDAEMYESQSQVDDLIDGINNISMSSAPMFESNMSYAPRGSDEELIQMIIEDNDLPDNELVNLYRKVTQSVKNGPPACLKDITIFKKLLKKLLDLLPKSNEENLSMAIQCEVLDLLAQIFQSDPLTDNYIQFVELIIVKMLSMHEFASKTVSFQIFIKTNLQILL